MITVRHATENDLPQILDIYNDIIKNTTAVYYYEPHTLEMRKAWFDERKKLGFPIFVAIEDEVVLGMSTIGTFRLPTAYKYTVENTVHVAAHARGKGIGKLLFDQLIDEAKEKKFSGIVWQVLDWNEPAINFYKKYNAGFDAGWLNCSIPV